MDVHYAVRLFRKTTPTERAEAAKLLSREQRRTLDEARALLKEAEDVLARARQEAAQVAHKNADTAEGASAGPTPSPAGEAGAVVDQAAEMEELRTAAGVDGNGALDSSTVQSEPAVPRSQWGIDGDGNLVLPRSLPDEPLRTLARSVTTALSALLAASLRIDAFTEDGPAHEVCLTIRDDGSGDAWTIRVKWDGADGRAELTTAIVALFGEPVPVAGLKRLRALGGIRAGVAQTRERVVAVGDADPVESCRRLLAQLPAGTRLDVDTDEGQFRATRVGTLAVVCVVDNECSPAPVDAWMATLTAAASPPEG